MKRFLLTFTLLVSTGHAQTSGAVGWLGAEKKTDEGLSALLSHDLAVHLGFLKPFHTQVFTPPVMTPQGPLLPMEVLYGEGFSEVTLGEHLLVLQDALGVDTVVGGVVSGNKVTVRVRQGKKEKTLTVTGQGDLLRTQTVEGVARLLGLKPHKVELTSNTAAPLLLDLKTFNILEAQKRTIPEGKLGKGLLEGITKPNTWQERAYLALMLKPGDLPGLDLSLPALKVHQAVLLEGQGQTEKADQLLANTTLPFAKTLSEVFHWNRGGKLPANWSPADRGVTSQLQAALIHAQLPSIKDTRRTLASLTPNSEFSLRGLQGVQLQKAEWKGAKATLEQLTDLNPKWLPYWTDLSWANFKLGKSAEALTTVKRALTLDPQDATSRYRLGLYQLAAGQEKEAEESYGKALQVSSASDTRVALKELWTLQNPVKLYFHAVLDEQVGSYRHASADLKTYLKSAGGEQGEKARDRLSRVVGATCTPKLGENPWTLGNGEKITVLKRKLVLSSNWNVRCEGVLPLPLTFTYQFVQDGKVLASGRAEPVQQPGLSGLKVPGVTVKLGEARDGDLTVKLTSRGGDGQVFEFAETYPLKGEASLKEEVVSSGLHLIDEQGRDIQGEDIVQVLLEQVKRVFSDREKVKKLYPELREQDRLEVLKVTPEGVEARLRKLLSLVGDTLGAGSQVFFPDEFVTPLGRTPSGGEASLNQGLKA
ncbi:tetratricopeptide repeat protein [Deinococcus cellulosilyticus]|uniref:Uncharacterized protein n=1 Tax=Deinococcus cellulosilyticus (strain DSM 18568 / NBRC 106333 / KACC 11606 / 5516J-15) TaxID=1223518 RepID=A0A511N192_DEIC1|nr:tetratricopeptide repeat protein [Deinococcus cellulosilyticus]GEM46654.1 hypothetical protein DC3_22890 [Deinococcus cellulosilyticus NBRC 106333 = KACC 11606]